MHYYDCGDTIFDQALNKLFHDNLELIQCNDLLAINDRIEVSSRERLSQELGSKSLQQRYRNKI